MSTKGHGHCLTFVYCHADLYFQTFAPKLLDRLKSQVSCAAFTIGRQNLCRSHDQDGHHAHIWINPLKVFSLEPNDKNDDPWMTFFFTETKLLAGKKQKQQNKIWKLS